MAIIKNKRYESPFVQVDRRTIQDHSLSFKARGLLAYILSFPPDWEISVKQFAAHAECDGKASIYSGLQELRKAGYVTFAPVRDPKKKHIQEWCYFAYERPEQNPNPETPRPIRSENQPKNPQPENRDVVENRAKRGKSYKAENPRVENLDVGKLDVENLDVGNRDAYSNNLPTNEVSKVMKLDSPPQIFSEKQEEEKKQEAVVAADTPPAMDDLAWLRAQLQAARRRYSLQVARMEMSLDQAVSAYADTCQALGRWLPFVGAEWATFRLDLPEEDVPLESGPRTHTPTRRPAGIAVAGRHGTTKYSF